ncbi:MAG: hypothetical protein LCH92_08345 [Proteobacteria bacterium]|nr:hypothetical protein [Pseudomonadota bacterium]
MAATDAEDANEPLGTCEGCAKAIPEGAAYHYTADACWLCADCAPMLSDLVRQWEEIVAAEPFNPGEIDCDSPEEMRAWIREYTAEIERNGDRKVMTGGAAW